MPILRLILTRRISLSRCHMSLPFCCYIWKFKWAIFKNYKPWILAGIRTAYLPPPRPLFAPDTREGLSSRHDRWRRLSVCFVAFSLTVERSVFNIIELQVLSFDNSTRDLRRTTNPVRWVFFTYNVMFINYYIILDFDVVILICCDLQKLTWNSDLTIEQLAFGTVVLVILKIKTNFHDFLLSIMEAEDDYVEVPILLQKMANSTSSTHDQCTNNW